VSRPLRILYPGAHYHLMARGNAGERCYRNDADRLLFLELLEHVVERFAWRLYAYCLMSNQSRRSPIEGTHDISHS
jgi:putative transposase